LVEAGDDGLAVTNEMIHLLAPPIVVDLSRVDVLKLPHCQRVVGFQVSLEVRK